MGSPGELAGQSSWVPGLPEAEEGFTEVRDDMFSVLDTTDTTDVSKMVRTEWGPTGLGLALGLREKRERRSSRWFLQGQVALASVGRQLGLVVTMARSQRDFTAGG